MKTIRLDIDAISNITLESSQQQHALEARLLTGLAAVDDRVARVEEMLQAQSNQVQANQLEQVGSTYDMSTERKPRRAGIKYGQHDNATQSDAMRIRVAPLVIACQPGCPCSCHAEQKRTTPSIVNRVLGRLFVGYAGVPSLGSKCDSAACTGSRASQFTLEYWFPFTFLSSAIVRLQVGYQPNLGTLLQLDTLRRVPDSAQCVSFALNGDIAGLKHLFHKGLASPRDVSASRGYTLLRWALYGKQYEACEFLIHAGADPDYRPIAASDNSPRNKACHFLLEGGLSDRAVGALRTITKDGYLDDFIDQARFTQIHKIVLGISMRDLENEISLNPTDVNVADAMSRTPLAWAAARGDTRAIVKLLGYGADPNITDVQLSGPLSNAASQGHTVAVRLLLEAGAKPDHRVPGRELKGSPLNCAARNATDTLLLKSLLDFGADVNASGTDGKTALIHAARTDNASFAMLLLEYGADINAVSADNSTPLTTAITFNSHNVLRLVLDRWHEYSVCPRLKGPNLLEMAALSADPETLHILAATDHLRVKYDKKYTIGGLGNRLRQRGDLTDDLAFAFDELLSVINQFPDSTRESSESLLEAGVPSCCLTRVDSGVDDGSKEAASSPSSEASFRDALESVS